jgi:hypothetical protein
MAYSPINNNKFDSGDVIDGADIAQLNDNIEDTRTLTVNQYATVYEWSNHAFVGQTQNSQTTVEGQFTFEVPTSTTYYGSKEVDFLTSGGQITNDVGLVFGDDIRATLELEKSHLDSALQNSMQLKIVRVGAVTQTITLDDAGLNETVSITLDQPRYDPSKIAAIVTMRVEDVDGTVTEKIRPTKLTVEVNVL